MKRLMKHNQREETIKKTHAERKGKKVYRSPHLVIYGDLSRVTRQKGGSKADGGPPPGTRL